MIVFIRDCKIVSYSLLTHRVSVQAPHINYCCRIQLFTNSTVTLAMSFTPIPSNCRITEAGCMCQTIPRMLLFLRVLIPFSM